MKLQPLIRGKNCRCENLFMFNGRWYNHNETCHLYDPEDDVYAEHELAGIEARDTARLEQFEREIEDELP